MNKQIASMISVAMVVANAINAQQTLQYQGPYELGEATYDYTSDAAGQRILNGKFTYTEVRNIPDRGGDQEVLITGNFLDDKKHLAWAVTIKSAAEDGYNETIIGNYLNGEKSGLWTHRIIRNVDDAEMKFSQVSFVKNTFRGPFKYAYDYPESKTFKKLAITGSFNERGQLDGEWKVSYKDANDMEFKDVMRFMNGVLAYRSFSNMTTGEVIESLDKLTFTESFFAKMHSVDSFAEVDGKKYGMRQMRLQHEVLVPVLTPWISTANPQISLMHNAPIPTSLIARGEFSNPAALESTAEIIDWKETPKGKAEYEAAMAIQKAYDTKIAVADLQFEKKNYVQALPLYKEAYRIKNEDYASEQIAQTEKLIRLEEEKKQLITAVNSRLDLWNGNEKMLAPETYYGKKKHLFEAYLLAAAQHEKDVKNTHQYTISFLDKKAYDQLNIDQLKLLKNQLDAEIEFQNKIKELVKRDDTKDLEKELKKLTDPAAITKLILEG